MEDCLHIYRYGVEQHGGPQMYITMICASRLIGIIEVAVITGTSIDFIEISKINPQQWLLFDK